MHVLIVTDRERERENFVVICLAIEICQNLSYFHLFPPELVRVSLGQFSDWGETPEFRRFLL